MDGVKRFLAQALPWPTPADGWWINIHSLYTNPSGKRSVGGRAFKDFGGAVRHVEWLLGQQPTDIYACMSGQRESKIETNKKGFEYARAVRSGDNATRLRTLWLDVDVKEGAFLTTEAAMTAFGTWRRAAGMPLPSLLVMTGSGGFHAHWVLEEPLQVHEWLPLAHALVNCTKALNFTPLDTGVSTDTARLLRLPDTLNCKWTPPRPASLAPLPDATYGTERIRAILAPWAVAVVLPRPVQQTASLAALSPRSGLFSGVQPRHALSAGIPLSTSTGWKPSLAEVEDVCPWIAALAKDGGNNRHEPEWRESLRIAYYTSDGRYAAHDLSDGHAAYTAQATDDKYDRIEKDHQSGRWGWPQCDTVWKAGAVECSNCPKRPLGKSPLNFPKPPAATTPITFVTSAGKTPTGMSLPPPWKWDADLRVFREEVDPEDPNVVTIKQASYAPMYDFQMVEPRNGAGGYGLNFSAENSGGPPIKVQISGDMLSDRRALLGAVIRQGIDLHNTLPEFRSLMSSFFEQIQRSKARFTPSEGFGWSDGAPGEQPGFVYGQMRWNCKGDTTCILPDPQLNQLYHPTGHEPVWKEAARLVTDQKRPDLDAILAMSFGAPLVHMTGFSGLVASVYSPDSGVGKSTAMCVATAVWSDPARTMGGLDDTPNFVNQRLGMLRHLPYFYDELKVEEHTAKFATLVFSVTQGKSKGRLTRSATAQPITSFNTILQAASNNSLVSYIVEHTKMTPAGLMRLFEWRATKSGTKGMISTAKAQALIGSLGQNYGHAGLTYAQFLGRNAEQVQKDMQHASALLADAVKAVQEERFWIATMACCMMGAKYANTLGLTEIDRPALNVFLVKEFIRQRNERGTSRVDITKLDNITSWLAQYVNERRQQTVVTDTIWRQAARPPAGFKVTLLTDYNKLQGRLAVHAVRDDKLLRVSRTDFNGWLRDKGLPGGAMLKTITENLPCKELLNSIGNHTTVGKGAREWLLEFELDKMSDFFNFD